ncbi:uncharacterized protein LOC133195100 [Saccostrea echinata]|uniref:uncharacterized protein LOC133195100 n=1 Tax=Saccostrea echinata TaxID=191078 RepID=UPI002A827832|nr:uncharacterized protein LOC133195100 [Saccostrea echinata]
MTSMDYLPDLSDDEENLIQKRRKKVLISDQEILMMLRSFQLHPCSWKNIIADMKENLLQLPADAQGIYKNCTFKQLKDRLSTKLSKLMVMVDTNIENAAIRSEIQKIKKMEKGLTLPRSHNKSENPKKDIRAEVVSTISSGSDEDTEMPTSSSGVKESRKRKAGKPEGNPSKKKPLMDLVRENHLAYNTFITKKVPKLLKALGVSSDSDDN